MHQLPYPVRDLSVYLTGSCNFDCTYCDRDVIDKIGRQRMSIRDVPNIVKFIKQTPCQMLSFHGGEPLQNIRVLSAIVEEVYDDVELIFIQTNGSLILKNQEFFEKFKDKLHVSISYDFMYQEKNRTAFNIGETLSFLNRINLGVQLQAVLEIQDPECFSLDQLNMMVRMNKRYNLSGIILIPLIQKRSTVNYEVMIDQLNIPDVLSGFMQFCHALYVYGIRVSVMGYVKDFERHYWDYFKQIVLSPDGYLYPDYGFVENKMVNSRLGTWREEIIFSKDPQAEEKVSCTKCHSCPQADKCGLRYVYHWSGQEPTTNKCMQLSTGLELLVKHLHILKSKPNLAAHLGFDNSNIEPENRY